VNENVKIVFFVPLFIKIGSIYVKSRPKYGDEPILHISLNRFHQLKCLIFVMFVCNYPG